MAYDIDSLVRDPDFQKSPFEARRQMLKQADPDQFGTLDGKTQQRMLADMKNEPWWMPDAGKQAAMVGETGHTPGARVIPEKSYIERVKDPENMKAYYKGVVRPTVEGLGALAGGAAGLASPVPSGTVVGGTLGYAGTKEGLNRLEEAVGARKPTQTPFRDATESIGEGVTAEMLGLGLGAVAGKGIDLAAKGTRAIAARRAPGTALQTERAALSKQFDVPLTVGEIRGSVGTKAIETQLERVPGVGIRGFRKKQGDALKGAAERLVDTLTTGTEDSGATIKTSLMNRLQKGKDTTRDAYNHFERIAHTEGVDTNIEPANIRQAAQELLDEYPDVFDRLSGGAVKSKLERILRDTAPTAERRVTGGSVTGAKPNDVPIPQTFTESIAGIIPKQKTPAPQNFSENVAGILPETRGARRVGESVTGDIKGAVQSGIQLAPQPTKIPLKDMKIFREQLNNLINRAYRSAGAVGNKEIRRLQAIKGAIDTDANTWAEQTGNQSIIKALQGANKTYQREVAPFKEFIVKKATGDEFDTDLMVKTFVKNDRPQLAAKLMGLLDDEGKAAVKHAVLKDALDLGTETKPDVPFSPAKFAGKLEKYGKTLKSVFAPDELQQVQGFVKLARVAERAGQFAENPPTGLRAGDMGLSAGAGVAAYTHPLATASTAAAIKFMSFMLTSNTGRKLLTRAGSVKDGTAMKSLVPQLAAQWERFQSRK